MTADEPAAQDQIGLQFSVYPLRQAHLHATVEATVRAAATAGVDVAVGRLSSFATGDEESVFAAVRAAFTAARSFGPTVMVVTLSSGLPSEGKQLQVAGDRDFLDRPSMRLSRLRTIRQDGRNFDGLAEIPVHVLAQTTLAATQSSCAPVYILPHGTSMVLFAAHRIVKRRAIALDGRGT